MNGRHLHKKSSTATNFSPPDHEACTMEIHMALPQPLSLENARSVELANTGMWKKKTNIVNSKCDACAYNDAQVSVPALLHLLLILLLLVRLLIHKLSRAPGMGSGGSGCDHFSTFPIHHLNQV